MPGDTFDPLHLDGRVSLNRTVLADLPAIEPSVRGRPASELIASAAMRRAIADKLAYPATEDPLVALDAAIASGDAAATALGRQFGTHLGYMLLTLMKDPGDEPFPRSYRAHWASIRHVYLGGGIVSGALGRLMRDEARRVLAGAGLAAVALEIAPHPSSLTLLGAARSASADATTALVFDFGGTLLKSGVATYETSSLKTLRVLAPTPSIRLQEDAGEDADADARRLGDYMTNAIVAGLAAAPDAAQAVCAIARYVIGGHPVTYGGGGGYGLLARLSDNSSAWLSQAVSRRLGRHIDVTLSHDGTTAARAFAGQPRTAVIMMGTWMGSGFAPEDASAFRPLAPDFSVENAT